MESENLTGEENAIGLIYSQRAGEAEVIFFFFFTTAANKEPCFFNTEEHGTLYIEVN